MKGTGLARVYGWIYDGVGSLLANDGGVIAILLTYLQFSVIKWAKQRPGPGGLYADLGEKVYMYRV